MYALFEDAGKFNCGRIMSETDSSLQVELESGKRQKLKAANLMLKFASPAPGEMMHTAQEMANSIDLDLAWEVLGDDEFSFTEFASDYFSPKSTVTEQAGALLGLHQSPHYFRRCGKGRFKKMPMEVLKQALAAIEKRKAQDLCVIEWAEALVNGKCPEPIEQQLFKILFKPEKNGPEYKAVAQAAKASGQPVLQMLQKAGAIKSPFQFHWQRFLADYFPKGTGFAPLQAGALPTLPLASVQAFSIDDSATTEIDDAFSVRGLGSGTLTVGIHIAAPGLVLLPDSPIDKVARDRLSTVYMPGYKVTMLPASVVDHFTLAEGKVCPAVSLYFTLKEDDLSVLGTQTLIEQVPILANLRHDQLDTWATEHNLSQTVWTPDNLPAALKGVAPAELAYLFRWAKHLKGERERVRGKPENSNRPDFSFQLLDASAGEPTGLERIAISPRKRGEPLDLLVAEAMIMANATWGKLLADCGVPGIYRSQAALAKGVKVRMGARPLPHAGMGVACYAWCTSPLRRYVDLVNQWQLIACVQHGTTAALVAHFKPKDAQLFGIISSFEETYSAYSGVQRQMELYWTLRYLQQEGIDEFDAQVFREGLARAFDLPLVLALVGGQAAQQGQHVRVKIASMDTLGLTITGTVVGVAKAHEADDAVDDDSEDTQALPALAFDLQLDDEPPVSSGVGTHDAADEGPRSVAVKTTEV
jgi:exoribonuclease II